MQRLIYVVGDGQVKIAPSIASANQSNLSRVVALAEEGGADTLHFDVEDGVFIPNLTFGLKTITNLRSYSKLPFDVHLEVHHPEAYLDSVVDAGADIVSIHVESTRFPYQAIQRLKALGVRCGLAFNAATALEVAEPIMNQIDVLHIMTADPDGVFLPGLVAKVEQARRLVEGRPIEIEVDGGVNFENAQSLVEAGATTLVAGRAIWGTKDPAAAIHRLRSSAAPPE